MKLMNSEENNQCFSESYLNPSEGTIYLFNVKPGGMYGYHCTLKG